MSRLICRPATWPSKPGARGALTRSSTCSTTCSAAVRPNRATRAAGNASWLVIVPVAVPSVIVPFDGFDSVSVSVSPASSCESSSTGTSMVAELLPALIVSVPLVEV